MPSSTTAPAGQAAAVVSVGPGYSDVSPHEVVRTSGDVLYAAVPTCATPNPCNGNALIMYAAAGSGVPASFGALDTAHEPAAVNSSDAIGTSSIAIDGNDLIWVAWIERTNGGSVKVATFSTSTNTWSSPSFTAATNITSFVAGSEGVSLALDANGAPHIAYAAAGASGQTHIMYANRVSGSWSAPVSVNDETIASGTNAMHPTLAFAQDGSLLFAWLDGGAEYTAGTIHTRVRSSSGSFSASTLISGQALSSVDDGPSLLVTPDGTRHLTFVDPNVTVKYWYGPDGVTWHGDRQPPSQQTHDPSLGPDGASGVYIYGHGTPQGAIDGTGVNVYRFHLAAGNTGWSPFALYASGTYDCSVSTRWSQFFMRFPAEVDTIFWNNDTIALSAGSG